VVSEQEAKEVVVTVTVVVVTVMAEVTVRGVVEMVMVVAVKASEQE